MKKYILKITLGLVASFFGFSANAQCPTITCPTNITVNNVAGTCAAIVNYTAPVGVDLCGSGSQTFSYTGALQTWTVPAGVTSVTITTAGAQGANGVGGVVGTGGQGGTASGNLVVIPGQILNIYVGGTNGYNGGGSPGASGPNTSGMGGGASDVRVSGTALANRVIVAAGGGGGTGGPQGSCTGGPGGSGGNGGATTGLNGTTGTGCGNGGTGGTGGTASTGGTGGLGNSNCSTTAGNGLPGVLGIGGTGGNGIIGCSGFTGSGGGGGGGGYYGGAAGGGGAGGGGGAWSGGGAGGGSSYIGGVTAGSTTAGGRTGNGEVSISYSGAGVPTTQTVGFASGATFPVGVTTNTFSATNAFGTVTCSFTVTVVDAEAPAISCLSNITVNNDAGTCGAVVNYTAPIGTDNCTGATTALTAGLGDGATFPVGTTTETYQVTDGAGNTTSCSFTVTVVDAEAPAISCLSNITVNNDAGTCGAVVSYTAPVGTDNCTGATTALAAGLGDGATFPVGTTTETYQVTDGAGNTTSCSFTVTVVDAEIPTITCPANVASCDSLVNGLATTTADNCSGETVTYTLSGATTGSGANDVSGTLFNLGTTTVWYYVTDVAGNQDSCSFDVTINPLPTVTIAAFATDTVCDTNPAIVLPTGTPAAGTYSGIGVSGGNFDPAVAGIGSYFVVYSFTDGNGCSNADSTQITVRSCVGINENTVLSNVSIFPNPANNVINVGLGNKMTNVSLTLMSIDGKVVYQLNNVTDRTLTIDISNNSKGIYFLRVDNGNDYNVYKVIKQ